MTNQERLRIREQYLLPKVPATRTPQLDGYLKQEVSTAVKSSDKQLVKIQTMVLGAVAPLTSVLETHQRGADQDSKEVLKAVSAALELIGNAGEQISHLQREKLQ